MWQSVRRCHSQHNSKWTSNMTNACIITFFMDNLNMKTVDLQRQVVKMRNPNAVPHYSIKTDLRHGASMDMAWALNGISSSYLQGA